MLISTVLILRAGEPNVSIVKSLHLVLRKVTPGIEPGIRVLQTHALPLGHVTTRSPDYYKDLVMILPN